MLSIIVSSRDIKLYKALSENIKKTVGCMYELIRIENVNKYGICEAYNRGVSLSQYNTVCFVHEDVLFHSENWGQKVCQTLQDKTIGLLGIAGQNYKSRVPSTWLAWYSPENSRALRIIQHTKNTSYYTEERIHANNIADVAVCDGVWLCTRKEVVLAHPFDSSTFTKFHFYDIDFSLTVLQNMRVCVTHDVLLEHFSNGTIDGSWASEAKLFTAKWGKKLPISLSITDKKQIKNIERLNEESFFVFIIKSLFTKPFSWQMFSLLKYTVHHPFSILITILSKGYSVVNKRLSIRIKGSTK